MSLLAFRKARDETANLSASLTDVSGARRRMDVFQPRQRGIKALAESTASNASSRTYCSLEHDFRRGLFHRILHHGGFRLNARDGLDPTCRATADGLVIGSCQSNRRGDAVLHEAGQHSAYGALSGGFVSGRGRGERLDACGDFRFAEKGAYAADLRLPSPSKSRLGYNR